MKKTHEKCYFCKGNMSSKKITVDYWWKEELIIIENVPAWVCTQCGEEVFEAPVVEELDRLAKNKTKKKTIRVDVKDFGAMAL